MKRQPRLSDPVTGALIDPETGEFDPGVAREVKDRISMKHMVGSGTMVGHNDEQARMLERIQAIMQEQEGLATSMKEMLDEAKSKGLNPAALKRAAALRLSAKKREKYVGEHRSLLDIMEAAGDPLVELA